MKKLYGAAKAAHDKKQSKSTKKKTPAKKRRSSEPFYIDRVKPLI